MSFIYRKTEPTLWTVGHYTPQGQWEPESDHDTADSAAQHTAWLNGQSTDPEVGR